MSYSCLINGRKGTELNVSDRGIQFGDGFFTTLKVQNGEPELWIYHWQRLVECAGVLNIPVPDDRELLKDINVLAGIFASGREPGDHLNTFVVKVIVTRGAGGRGYVPPTNQSPTRIVSSHAFPLHYAEQATQGVRLGVADTRLATQPALAGLKTLNRLEQVLIKQELAAQNQSGSPEDLLVLDGDGYVVETSAANLFWRKGTQWFTPDLSRSGVKGVVRQKLLETNPHVYVVRETLSAVADADEAFICNSLMGLIPITSIADNKLPCVRTWTAGAKSVLSDPSYENANTGAAQ